MPIVENLFGQVLYQPLYLQGYYPIHVFPTIIAEAVREVCWKFNVPIPMAAHAAIGAASLVSQNYINVQCPGYEPAPVTLFLIDICNSSAGKSLMVRRFFRSVSKYEQQQNEEFPAKMRAFQAETKIWLDDQRWLAKKYLDAKPGSDEKAQLRKERLLHEDERPVKPVIRNIRITESNIQGLREVLIANHAIGIVSADGGPTLNGETFSQPAVLCDYWSGEERATGRVSGTRRSEEPRVTILIMAQEDQVADYMKRRGSSAFDTGLLARFLLAASPIFDMQGISIEVDDTPEHKLDLFNERIWSMLNQPVPPPRERKTLQLSDEAKLYWKLFKEGINKFWLAGNYADNIKSFFRKLGQMASRFAALFHYVSADEGDIPGSAMKAAIELCEWYIFEYIRIFSPYAQTPQQKDVAAAWKLLEWFKEAVTHPMRYSRLTSGRYTERDLRNYSNIRGDREQLGRAIGLLHQWGYISTEPGKNGGLVIIYPANNLSVQAPVANYPHSTSSNDRSSLAQVNEQPGGVATTAAGGIQHHGFNNRAQERGRELERAVSGGKRSNMMSAVLKSISPTAAQFLSHCEPPSDI
ncbi:DUF3987 domain-containing protein [Burkholderia sp. Ed8]|uniref:DUF3987 domain-containing protein n=1 Tax=Burkholderia sp. Ed8 TaxID=3112957 RepID=UPI00345D104D